MVATRHHHSIASADEHITVCCMLFVLAARREMNVEGALSRPSTVTGDAERERREVMKGARHRAIVVRCSASLSALTSTLPSCVCSYSLLCGCLALCVAAECRRIGALSEREDIPTHHHHRCRQAIMHWCVRERRILR